MKKRDVKFHWRQRPPKASDPLRRRDAGKLQRGLKAELPYRPWSKQLRVAVSEDRPDPRSQAVRLGVWIILPSPVDAFWAASIMGHVHRLVSAVNPDVRRIAVTAPKESRTGYAPLISWRFQRSDSRLRAIRDSETLGLIRYLNWCGSAACRTVERSGGTDLLMHAASSPGIQWEAVSALVRFASDQGFLTCSVNEALTALTSPDCARQPDWACAEGLTRWQAVKSLSEARLLEDFVGRQRPLRPAGSTATLDEILNFVAAAFCITADDLKGAARHAHIMHARQMAAAVMRRATSRTLTEIGESLGGRDHTTVINGLERIEKWRRLDPMHSWIVESLTQIADNIGILKIPALRRAAQGQLERGYGGLAARPAPEDPPRSVSLGNQSRQFSRAGRQGNVIVMPFRTLSKPGRPA